MNNTLFKKLLTTAVLGVSALNVIIAHATTPGVYVTGQLGYANTHLKDQNSLDNFIDRKSLLDGLGMDHFDYDTKKLANNGLAGRLAVGYQFNQYFALEMGYLQLGQKKTDLSGTGTDPDGDSALAYNGSFKLSQYAFDLAAKGIVPISDQFNIYAKLGVAYLTSTLQATGRVRTKDISYDHRNSNAEHQWAPEAAVGVSYDITPNLFIDTSWTHIHPTGKDRLAKNIDFVAVGIGYSLG